MCDSGDQLQKPVKKVRFVDFDPSFVAEGCGLVKLLSQWYDVRIVKDPDYLIDGGLGYHHVKYDCIKIELNEENQVVDFNQFDYGIGSDDLVFGDRYLRIPLYGTYGSYLSLYERKFPSDDELLNRKFCSFVVSNGNGDPIRRKFFERLSQYKRVDSGGRWMNNVGGPVKDKLDFCRGYKFNIAFENSISPGYTTEKLMQPLSVCSVPIYYGNASVDRDFRLTSMIYVRDEDDVERAVNEVIRLDNDDAAYLSKVKEPCLVHPDRDHFVRMKEDFLRHIFDQPLDKARRLNAYGYQAVQRKYTKYALSAHQLLRDVFWGTHALLRGKIRRVVS